MAFTLDWIKKPNGFLKVISFLLCVFLLVLLFHGLEEYNHYRFSSGNGIHGLRFIILVTPYNAFILFFWLVCYCVDNCKPGERAITEAIYLISQAIFFLVIAILILVRKDIEGIDFFYVAFVVILFILFLIDGIITVIKKVRGSGGGG